ncbi:MAG: hypothetical protein NDP13_02150 [Crenarchaeota archaeon]|nr:hypothetical protein [Thermoproteota archaeon]MCR8455136.1 hypothetical protein [Thermoproteota archaeon]MCR8501477.1 hypothetical protein [Thermoproteota archaeon]
MIGPLKKVGEILHISNLTDNILIIKLDEFVKPGTVIYNGFMRELGVVIECFGPTKSPYARVKINSKEKDYILELLDRRAKEQTSKDLRQQLLCYVIAGEEEKVQWRKMPHPRKGQVH